MKYRATPIEFQSSLSLFPQPGWSWMQSQAYLFEKNGSRARERENRVQVNGFQDISQSGVQNKYRTNSLRFWITIHRWKNAKASIPFLRYRRPLDFFGVPRFILLNSSCSAAEFSILKGERTPRATPWILRRHDGPRSKWPLYRDPRRFYATWRWIGRRNKVDLIVEEV